MRFVSLVGAASLVVLSLGVVPDPANAQEPLSRDERELAGHWFIPSSRIPDPFPTTHARFLTGGGVASGFQAAYVVPVVDTIRISRGDAGFFGLEFEFQQNFFKRGSVRLSLEGSGRSGTDTKSLLAIGLTSVYGVELEAKYRILRTERLVLTGHALLSRKNLYGISPLSFAETIIDSGGLNEDATLVTEGQISRSVFGPSVAFAFKPWLGFTGFAFVGPGDPLFQEDQGDETAFRGGVTGDVDFKHMNFLPIGVLLGYDYDSFPEGSNAVVQGIYTITVGVAYTGRDDFSIGLEYGSSKVSQKDYPDDFGAQRFALTSRYYF